MSSIHDGGKSETGSFVAQYLRLTWTYAKVALGVLAAWLVIGYGPGIVLDAPLAVIETILKPFDWLLLTGSPEDPNWQVPIDLPNARGNCADHDATAYQAPLTGQTLYQTEGGC